MSKITIHIPTADFAYIEQEFEAKEDTTARDLAEHYNQIETAIKGRNGANTGLPQKEWNSVLEEYLTTNTVKDGVNIYQLMSPEQQGVIQEIKRAIKRIDAKNNKDENNVN